MELEIHWDIRDGIFKDNVISDMFMAFEYVIRKIATNNDWTEKNILNLSTRYFKERDCYNNTTKNVEKRVLYDGVLRNILRVPNKVAIIADEKEYTYRELGKYISSVVKLLQDKGVQKGDNIAIIQPRGVWQIASAIGSMIVGAAFVPVDINQPLARQKKIVIGSNSRFVLIADEVNIQIEDIFSEKIIRLKLSDKSEMESVEYIIKNPVSSPEDLAYIIFTSGTS